MSWQSNFRKKLRRGSGVVFALAFLGFSALCPSFSQAIVIMEFDAVLDITAGQDRGIRPIAVSFDRLTGDVCVTDGQHSNFHVINEHGIEVFKTGGFSGLSLPIDGSLLSNGDFIFIGRNQESVTTIRRLNFMGEPMEFSPEIPLKGWEPGHLAVTRDDGILTADSNNNILAKHDSKTGALLWKAEIPNDGTDELQLGRPVEAPDGRIYLPSGMLHHVVVFSEDGKKLETLGRFGAGPGRFVFPVGVAIGPEESILVLDRMRHKILMFDPDHNLLGEFGSMGAGLGQFYHPAAIAASKEGRVYVAQGYGSRVQVFKIRNTKAD